MKFVKSFFSIVGIHLAMCVVPFLLMPILNNDPRYTIDVPMSAGQILVYSIYFILFFGVYFWIGRTAGENPQEKRMSLSGTFARLLATALITVAGLYLYYGVIVPQRLDLGFMSFFGMPQLMVKKAITDEVIGNKTFSTIVMVMPAVLVWVGYISTGFKKKK